MEWKTRKLNTFMIKFYDSLDYFYHRAKVKLNYYINLTKKIFYMRSDINSILIIRLASFGDVVRSTAIIEDLRRKYPKAKLDFLTTGSALPIIKNNPLLHSAYTLQDLHLISEYDWIINLQQLDPPESFLQDVGLRFTDILDYISHNVKYKLITGRYCKDLKDSYASNPFFYSTEMEWFYMSSLLPYSHSFITNTKIYLDKNNSKIPEYFGLKNRSDYLGIFLGSNSTGGDDNGTRTYSVSFIEKLIKNFINKFTIVIVGQSNVKIKDEVQQYQILLEKYPKVINLVDATTLEELLYVINTFRLFISCDSGPFHIAMALKVPVIGLYVNSARFRVSPKLYGYKYVLINSFNPCFQYNYRWRHHCLVCCEKHSRMYNCNLKEIDKKIDYIPINMINNAAKILLNN
jgi:ADP-heptose:LPS heptosyltransferase